MLKLNFERWRFERWRFERWSTAADRQILYERGHASGKDRPQKFRRRTKTANTLLTALLFTFVSLWPASAIGQHYSDFIPYPMVATAYAPLDARAVEGTCYSGDRWATASGSRSTPGVSIAAGKELPFGTILWIDGVGARIVHDRGSMTRAGHLDLMVDAREEALKWGVREVYVRFIGSSTTTVDKTAPGN